MEKMTKTKCNPKTNKRTTVKIRKVSLQNDMNIRRILTLKK